MPPLKALHYFDCAMRHGSFTIAAQELSVTPGAVGQQIRKLEEWLGVSLFSRHVRHVLPTADGQAYWARVRPALAQLAEASRSLRDNRSLSAHLTLPPTLAAKWFARRMPAFVAAHPSIALHLSSSSQMVDFDHETVDLAVRYFDGIDAALDVQLLYADQVRVFCSPAYRQRLGLDSVDDLHRATLLHTTLHPHWARWLAQFAGLDAQQVASISAIHFDQSLLSIEAARRDQGLVLTSPLLVEEEVANASLVEPFAQGLALDRGFYVVHPRGTVLRPAVQALKQWLLAQACV